MVDISKIKNNPKLLAAILELIQNAEADSKPAPKTRGRKPKAQTAKGRKNLFDTMPEKNLHKDDTKIDKVLLKGKKPSPRRDTVELITIKCRSCGDKVQVNPDFVFDAKRYKCNDCSSNADDGEATTGDDE
jgi:hypothetical protein